MSDIEPKEVFMQIGLDLINEYRVRKCVKPIDYLVIDTPEVMAFIRSIQLHEKTKQELQGVKQELAEFRQDVSEFALGVREYMACCNVLGWQGECDNFIIPAPKPDPLVEVLAEVAADYLNDVSNEKYTNAIRAAMEARGLEIREKNDV